MPQNTKKCPHIAGVRCKIKLREIKKYVHVQSYWCVEKHMIHVQTFLQKSTLRFSDVVYHIHANQSPATHVFVKLFKQSICLKR